AVAHCVVLARHVLPVARSVPGALVGSLAPAGPPGHEVVDPLPARALAEDGSQCEQPIEERARPVGSAPLVLVARKLWRVVVAVHLPRLLCGVGPAAERGGQPAEAPPPYVQRGLRPQAPPRPRRAPRRPRRPTH